MHTAALSKLRELSKDPNLFVQNVSVCLCDFLRETLTSCTSTWLYMTLWSVLKCVYTCGTLCMMVDSHSTSIFTLVYVYTSQPVL